MSARGRARCRGQTRRAEERDREDVGGDGAVVAPGVDRAVELQAEVGHLSEENARLLEEH